jgi:hypothetical protein
MQNEMGIKNSPKTSWCLKLQQHLELQDDHNTTNYCCQKSKWRGTWGELAITYYVRP